MTNNHQKKHNIIAGLIHHEIKHSKLMSLLILDADSLSKEPILRQVINDDGELPNNIDEYINSKLTLVVN